MKNLLKNKIINNICCRVVSVSIPFKNTRKKLRKKLRHIILEDFKYNFSLKYKDYYQFLVFKPWGDLYIASSLLVQFKKQNNAKIVVMCINEQQKEVLESFEVFDEIEIIPSEIYYSLLVDVPKDFKQNLKKGEFYTLCHWTYSEANENKSSNFLELYSKMLGLDYPVHLAHYASINNDNSNTILINPKANSFNDEISNEFWINLADELVDCGYEVVFNSTKQKYGKYKIIFLPMLESIKFALQCKYVIGIRSGFDDILAINEFKNHIVIYPKNLYFKTITQKQHITEFTRAFVIEQDKTFEENILRITSLKMFNDYAMEICYQNDDQLKNEILKCIMRNS